MSEFQFFAPPPELLEEAERQRDLHMMHTQEVRHKVYGFLDSLTKEQVQDLGTLVRAFAQEGDGTYAKFIDGYLAGLAKEKFGICPGCGTNHEDDLDEMREPQMPEDTADPFSVILMTEPGTPERMAELEAIAAQQAGVQVVAPYVLTEDDLAHMEMYNLDDLRDEDPPHHLLGFICKGCGMRYISIADRMLRPIDSCSGCHLKSAHG